MSTADLLDQELTALEQLLSSPTPDPDQLREAGRSVLAKSAAATPTNRSAALARLAPFIAHPQPACVEAAALLCGAITEQGTDPSPMAAPLLNLLVPLLQEIAAESNPATPQTPTAFDFTAFDASTFDPSTFDPETFNTPTPESPTPATPSPDDAKIGLASTLLPAVSMFEASPSLRAAHRDLLALSTALENTLPTAYCLTQLLSIPDQEPILVINPATRTGILGSISGIDLNFHLHTLLLEHFPGEDGQPGRRLSPAVRELLATNEPGREEFVTGIWNLYNWTALDADRRLPEGANQNSNNWIWNEAGPADIAQFEGRRAILLGPAPYARTWSVHRSFSAIEPRLEIEKVLTPQEVEDFLTRMVAAR